MKNKKIQLSLKRKENEKVRSYSNTKASGEENWSRQVLKRGVGKAQNYNRYGYVLNNPLAYTDPSGEKCDICPEGGNNYPTYNEDKIVYNPGASKDVEQWLKDNISTKKIHEGWLGRTTNSIVGGIASFFGGSGDAPAFQMANVEQSQFYNFGNGASKMVLGTVYDAFDLQFGLSNIYKAFGGTKPLMDLDPTEAEKNGYYTAFAASLITPAGWEAGAERLGVKGLSSLTKVIKNGGRTFAQYKTSYWMGKAKPVLDPIVNRVTGQTWKQFMELHHRFIPQRWKWAPNWLKNNRFNLQELNSLEHAMKDPYRARFAPKWVKEYYNLIWK
jgi:hypothetical protein